MLSSLFRSRSLLFIFLTLVRVVGLFAMFMLVVAELLNIANNIQGYENKSGSSGGGASPSTTSGGEGSSIIEPTSTLSTSFDMSSHSRSVATATEPATRSTTRTRDSSSTAAPTTASTFVQPDSAQQRSISSAAAAQASRLTREGESSSSRRLRRHAQVVKRAASASDDDDNSGQSDDFFPGTDVPKETGGLAFVVIERFITIFVLLFLLISEMAPPRVSAWYQRHFPPLGPEHGVGWLGILMVWIGAACLGHATSLNSKALEFQRVAAWMVFILGLINCLFGVTLFESVRPFRALLPSDQPQEDFESYSSTHGHHPPAPPLRSLSLRNNSKEAQEEAAGDLSSPPQPAAPGMTEVSRQGSIASSHQPTNRRSFKGFGPRKPSLAGLGSGILPTAAPSTHNRTASASGRLFNISAPRAPASSYHSSSRSVSGPPTYLSEDLNRAEMLAGDPATAPALRFARQQ